MINKLRGVYLAMLAMVLGFFTQAYAAIPAEITTLHTDIDTEWGVVKTAVIGFVAFSLLMFVVLKIRSKKAA